MVRANPNVQGSPASREQKRKRTHKKSTANSYSLLFFSPLFLFASLLPFFRPNLHSEKTKITSRMSKSTIDPFTNAVVYAPATVHDQRGGALYDRLMNRMATTTFFPRALMQSTLIYVEAATVSLPEWILGEKNGGAPPIEKRIDSSIAASRVIIADTVARGGRRKVAVLTGKIRKKKNHERKENFLIRCQKTISEKP